MIQSKDIIEKIKIINVAVLIKRGVATPRFMAIASRIEFCVRFLAVHGLLSFVISPQSGG